MLLNNFRRALVNTISSNLNATQIGGMTGEIKTTGGVLCNPTQSYKKYPTLDDLPKLSSIAIEATLYNSTAVPLNSSWGFTASQIYLGTGNVTPTIGDYKLSGELITGLTSQEEQAAANNNSITFSAIATNNTESPVTIKEIGLGGYYTGNTPFVVLLTRDVLATPVTLNVGDSKRFSITIDFRSLTDTTVNE